MSLKFPSCLPVTRIVAHVYHLLSFIIAYARQTRSSKDLQQAVVFLYPWRQFLLVRGQVEPIEFEEHFAILPQSSN